MLKYLIAGICLVFFLSGISQPASELILLNKKNEKQLRVFLPADCQLTYLDGHKLYGQLVDVKDTMLTFRYNSVDTAALKKAQNNTELVGTQKRKAINHILTKDTIEIMVDYGNLERLSTSISGVKGAKHKVLLWTVQGLAIASLGVSLGTVGVIGKDDKIGIGTIALFTTFPILITTWYLIEQKELKTSKWAIIN